MSVVELICRTPIWTGGSDRSSGVVHESGLMGSLRWWYEGLIRGLGGGACDPTDRGRCQRLRENSRLCPVCRLFGATGWRRRFRLEAQGFVPTPLFFVASPAVYVAAGNWLWRMFGGERHGQKTGRGSDVRFTFGTAEALWTPAGRPGRLVFSMCGEEDLGQLALTLSLMERYGAIGAKSQHGFGVFAVRSKLTTDSALAEARRLAAQWPDTNGNRGFYSLARFFSHEFVIPESILRRYRDTGKKVGEPANEGWRESYVPCAFDIRYKSRSKNPVTRAGEDVGLRPWIKERLGRTAATLLFGESDAKSDEDRRAGRVGVSGLFKVGGEWRLRIWGEAPTSLSLPEIESEVDLFVQKMFTGATLRSRFDFHKELEKT